MDTPLRGISSMATRQVLADLAAAWRAVPGGMALDLTSVGGVDAARRVAAGEPFDLVFLAADAIDRLADEGHVAPGERVDLMRSQTVVAVAAGAAPHDIASEATLRDAVLRAPSIGYSTGPSGVALQRLFARWGIAEELAGRTVQARPGEPVGALIAHGRVAMGFQQRSELVQLPGIAILGPLPAPVQIDTVFSGAPLLRSPRADAARRALAFMASPAANAAKHAQGMEPPAGAQ